jgi:predicted small secreted protein
MIKVKTTGGRIARFAGAAAFMLSLAACNTVHGAGKDVSAVGHDVSRGASAAQQGISNATGASTH